MNQLALIESSLRPLAPRFANVLGGVMEPSHLIQSVLVSVERNPRLAEADMQSIMNAAMTFANLRLPVDGATGQGFLLPFNNTRLRKVVVTPVIGYKGFNTIGARGGVSINGGIVREGDLEWDYREGTGGFVHHKKRLDNPERIIAAWAVAESRDRPPAVAVLGIGEIMEIESRSPAVRGKAETPWNDPKIGFPAMAEKSAKRRLNRVLPFEIDDGRFHKAARIDEAYNEKGLPGYIREDGAVVIDGSITPSEVNQTPSLEDMTTPRSDAELERHKGYGKDAAEGGSDVLRIWWERLGGRLQHALKDYRDTVLKPRAAEVDKEEPQTEQQP